MTEPGQTSRAGKRRLRQVILWCQSGSPRLARGGLCAACYAREQHDRRCYGGHRAAVVSRDGRFRRVCAEREQRPPQAPEQFALTFISGVIQPEPQSLFAASNA